MINIFVIGEVLNIDSFNLINEYYSTVKNVNFYYCLTVDYDLQLNNSIRVSKQQSIYDYIKLIIDKYKFDDNDEIFINIAGCILFLNTKEFYQYDKSLECFDATNYLNIIKDNIGEEIIVKYDHIMKTGLEFFIDYNKSNIITDLSINGIYFQYHRLVDFLNNLKLDITNCVMGDDLILHKYIEKITDYTMINGFSFYDSCEINRNYTIYQFSEMVRKEHDDLLRYMEEQNKKFKKNVERLDTKINQLKEKNKKLCIDMKDVTYKTIDESINNIMAKLTHIEHKINTK